MVIRTQQQAPPQITLPSRFRPAPAPRPRRLVAPPFQRILGAVDGGPRGAEALREAIASASAGAVPHFVELSDGDSAVDFLLAEAERYDLLAIAAGETATQIAHRYEGPLLVTRSCPFDADCPGAILLASDGSPGSRAAARTATRLAQIGGLESRLIYVPDGMHPEYYGEVLKQLMVIEKAAGPQPVVVGDSGRVADRICKAADAARASLIVMGHRGLGEAKALGSVSEQVVQRAHASVLLVSPEA